jgi:hypothetical protein
MSVAKARKAKNSGDLIEALQSVFASNPMDAALKDLLDNPPNLKWGIATTIDREGLKSWVKGQTADDLVDLIKSAAEQDEFRSGVIGCLYLFGLGDNKRAIELSEMLFERAEAGDDYIFNATNMIAELAASSLSWAGTENNKYYVSIDRDYLYSTCRSVLEDFRVSDRLFETSTIVTLASGLAKAGAADAANDLLSEHISRLTDFSDFTDFGYSLTPTIDGMPDDFRGLAVSQVPWVSRDTFEKTRQESLKTRDSENGDELDSLIQYIDECLGQL